MIYNRCAWVLLALLVFPICGPDAGVAAEPAGLEALRAAIREWERRAPDPGDPVVRSNLPLARLKLRKAELLLTPGKYAAAGDDAVRWEIEQGFTALARLGQGKVAYAGDHGGFSWPYDGRQTPAMREKAGGPAYYEYGMDADTDGSPQPFLVEVPPEYDPTQQWPLLLYLHGYHGRVDMIRKWDTRALAALAKEKGYVVVAPHGRSETDFLGVGEADVLQALREVKRYYSIDPERIYLIGGSMGGYGGLNLALHYPHMWAAVVANVASSDMLLFGGLPREELLSFRRWHYLRNNPLDLAGNAPSLPISGRHGGSDTWVPPEHSVRFADRRRSLGGSYEYEIVPGSRHEVCEQFAPGLAFLAGKRRRHWPKLVRHKTYSLRYDQSYWVRILGLGTWGEAAEIEARVEGNVVTVKTDNVSAYELTLGLALVDADRPVRVLSDGAVAFEGSIPDGGRLRVGALASDAPLRKTRVLCGAFDDVLNHPFLVVTGTVAESGEGRRRLDEDAEWFRARWEAYTDGWPRMKKDADVTEADIETYGLLLLGRPSENALTARVAGGLPVVFPEGAFEVNGHRYEGPDLGLALIYPNPLNPERYVAVLAGARYGLHLPENHPFSQLPDLLVFRADPVETAAEGASRVFGKPNQHLCAAFFDSQWQFSKQSWWTRDSVLRPR